MEAPLVDRFDQTGKPEAAGLGSSPASDPALVRVAVILLVLAVATYLLSYLLNVILARSLPPETYGDLSVALRVLTIVASIALLGTGTSSKRFLAKYLRTHNDRNSFGFLRWNFSVVRRTFIVSTVLSMLLLATLAVLHVLQIRHIESYHLTVYLLCLTPVAALAKLFSNYLLCSDRVVESYFLPNTFQQLMLVLLFSASFLFASFMTPNVMIGTIFFVAYLCVIGCECFIIQRFTPISFAHYRKARHLPTHDPEQEREWTGVSTRLIITTLGFLLVSNLDLLIVESVSRNEVEVGYYSAVVSIAGIIWLAGDCTTRSMTSRISILLETAAGRLELQAMLKKVLLLNLAMTGTITAGVLVLGRFLLGHFGQDYLVAMPTLAVVAAGSFIGVLLRPAALLMAYGDQEKALLRITLFEFVLLAGFGAAFTYFFGMMGAALALILSITVRGGLTVICARRGHGIRPLGYV